MRSACLADPIWRGQLGVDGIGQLDSLSVISTLAAIGIVLGLADQVGRDEGRHRRCASAMIAISVGPASESMLTVPCR